MGKLKTQIAVPSPFRTVGGGPPVVEFETPLFLEATNGVGFCIRYIAAPYPLSRVSLPVPGRDLVSPILISAALHGTLAFTIASNPPQERGPKLKDVPERYARLIAVKPPPAPVATPAPTPPPTPPPVAEKAPPQPPQKVEAKVPPQKKPRPVAQAVHPVARPTHAPAQPQALADRNKFPLRVEASPKRFEAQKVGALSAFAALNPNSTPKLSLSSVNVQTTSGKSDGAGLTTGNVMSNLTTSANGGAHGRGSMVAMQTGKVGYGAGGLSGRAGKRDVAGAKVGRFEVGAFSKTEGLTREQVLAEVQRHQSQIQQCYERSLIDLPTLAGRAQFEWMISAEGSVSDVSIKESTLQNGGKLLECVKAIFRKMHFAKSKNHETTNPSIGLPFGRL